MKDTKGIRQVLEEMFIKAGVKLTEIGWELAGEVAEEAEKELQEIMLGMLPEPYTQPRLHDYDAGFNTAISHMEQNIRGGFKV